MQRHHDQPGTTIAILGADTVVGGALCALLGDHGYRINPLDAHPTGIVDELLEGADLLLLAPRLDTGASEAFLGAMCKSAPQTADVPVILLSTTLEEDLPEKVDIVFEAAGGSLFERSFDALRPFGRVIQYGLSTREKTRISNANLLRTSRGVIGFWLMHCIGQPGMLREPLDDLFERAARGEVVARVGEAYPLAEVARAHEDLLARRTSGKLIVDPSIA